MSVTNGCSIVVKSYVIQRQGLDCIGNGFAICFKDKQYFECSICKKNCVFKVHKPWVKLWVDNGKTEGFQVFLSYLVKNNVLYFKLYRYSKAVNMLRSMYKACFFFTIPYFTIIHLNKIFNGTLPNFPMFIANGFYSTAI